MNRQLNATSLPMLGALGMVTGVTVFVLTRLAVGSGASPVMIPQLLFLGPLAIGLVIAWQGWQVRAFKLGKRSLDPLRAARIWVLSQATSRAGAILAGGAGGIAAAYATSGPTAFLTAQAWYAALAALGSVAMSGLGLLAERWCRVDDDSDPDTPGAQPAGA